MKKIAILTTFRIADDAYSLNQVVQNQIKMFTMSGYKLKVIVAKGFIESENKKDFSWYQNPMVELAEISDVPVSNELYVDKTFDEDVDTLLGEFRTILENIDVVITHDIVYQPAAIKHNLAIRKMMQNNNKLKFIHWVHSAGRPADVSAIRGGGDKYNELVGVPFPSSFYIVFNEYSKPRVASWFNVEESEVKYVPHPHDFFEGKSSVAIKIANQTNLLEKDVACFYPCRLDRGKQPEIVIKTMAEVKNLGRSVTCIIGDFHSTAGDKAKYREELKAMGIELGLSETELVFLSELELGLNKIDGFNYEIPHEAIQELFDFTNTFILPSRSETYSLVAQEAAMKRNFLVLNQDFPPFRSIYGDAPLYRQFSSNMDALTGGDGETATRYQNEQGYHRETAQHICYAQEHTSILKTFNQLRKTRNLKYVFRRHIEPLLVATPAKYNY